LRSNVAGVECRLPTLSFLKRGYQPEKSGRKVERVAPQRAFFQRQTTLSSLKRDYQKMARKSTKNSKRTQRRTPCRSESEPVFVAALRSNVAGVECRLPTLSFLKRGYQPEKSGPKVERVARARMRAEILATKNTKNTKMISRRGGVAAAAFP
jgi:hypothetical protein